MNSGGDRLLVDAASPDAPLKDFDSDLNSSVMDEQLSSSEREDELGRLRSSTLPNGTKDRLLGLLAVGLNGMESKTTPMKNMQTRLLEELNARRPKSLAGPSPNYRFGPKAHLLQPEQQHTTTFHDPGNTRLKWNATPHTVLVIKKIRDDDVKEPFVRLIRCLLKKNMRVLVEKSALSEQNLLACETFVSMKDQLSTFIEGCDSLNGLIDFIICLGGDGTLLYASSLFQTSVPPVMAFHLGSLGFLTPFEFDDIEEKIESIVSGHSYLTLRSRLQCVLDNTKTRATPASEDTSVDGCDRDGSTFVILNDVVIDRGPSPYLVHIDLFVDGQMVTSVQGDGLIISTPTGSTAYAVAAGASIMHPAVPAIMITPICPHSLSFRPIVIPAGCELRVTLSDNARDSAWVSFDGRNRQQLSRGDSVKITSSVYPLPSICAADQMQDWFNGLAGCLHWNVRKPQKPLQ